MGNFLEIAIILILTGRTREKKRELLTSIRLSSSGFDVRERERERERGWLGFYRELIKESKFTKLLLGFLRYIPPKS